MTTGRTTRCTVSGMRKSGPLRGGCTSAAAGRSVSIGPYEVYLVAGCARQTDPVWKADYRATRAVGQAAGDFGVLAGQQFVDGGAGDAESLGDPGRGPAGLGAGDHELAGVAGGACVSVGHEDLLV